MRLKVLGSSSHGNCYILDNGKEALVIEAGIHPFEVTKALNFDIRRVSGCLVSHEDGDHSRYLNWFYKYRIPCFMSQGTDDALKIHSKGCTKIVKHNISKQVGSFKVLPFDIQHDAAEPLGFIIEHSETGKVLFLTDTCYSKYIFHGLHNILIECNYRLDILDRNVKDGLVPVEARNRIIQSHMSFETCLETLKANDLIRVNNIVLIHLSNTNSNEKQFMDDIFYHTRKDVFVAKKGLNIELYKTPF